MVQAFNRFPFAFVFLSARSLAQHQAAVAVRKRVWIPGTLTYKTHFMNEKVGAQKNEWLFPKANTDLMRTELELEIWIIWAGALFSYYHALMSEDVYLNGPVVLLFKYTLFKTIKLHFNMELFYFDLCMFLCDCM